MPPDRGADRAKIIVDRLSSEQGTVSSEIHNRLTVPGDQCRPQKPQILK